MKMFVMSAAILAAIASAASAQTVEPTYKGDPAVYKIIFEDANFRVIESVRPKGVKDKFHSHPLPSVVYNATDCKTKLYETDGKTRDAINKAGTANASPITASHSAENIGDSDCKQIFVEKK